MTSKKLTNIISTAVPLPAENIDTDQIIPARFLKATHREGFGNHLFYDWRYNNKGALNPDCILNQPAWSGRILIAGKNFGCGSSREHAAWAIKDYGFDVIICSFFADIFRNNALNNFLLPLQVSEEVVQQLLQTVTAYPSLILEIDMAQTLLSVRELNLHLPFPMNSYKKSCFLNGHDDLAYLLSIKEEIKNFERNRPVYK